MRVFFETIGITENPRPAIERLTQLCCSQRWRESAEDAREWAERVEERFLQALREELGQLSDLGRFAPFAFNSSSEYMLQGSAFVEPSDTQDVREAKHRRARLSSYAAALDELSPYEFEALCAGILDLLGVDEPRLTPRAADEGIDFYGRQPLEKQIFPEDVYPTIQKQLKVWLVGQAKHYRSTQVSTPDIRELVGSIQLARGAAFGSKTERYSDLRLRVCDPVFYLFFTTGRISADGWRLLDRSGVVGMDGEMVTSFLADRAVGVSAGAFDSAEFRGWIKRYIP